MGANVVTENYGAGGREQQLPARCALDHGSVSIHALLLSLCLLCHLLLLSSFRRMLCFFSSVVLTMLLHGRFLLCSDPLLHPTRTL